MDFTGRHIVITGGGGGVGSALADRFAKDGPRGITIVDWDIARAERVASRVDGLAIEADVGGEPEILRVIAEAEARFGPIDVFFSNAAIARPLGGAEAPNEGWQQLWDVNVMAHVWAVRALLPAMTARGEGYLVNTASAAGLIQSPGAVPYTVTKHAALALAETLAVMHGAGGVRFSCVCPGLIETSIVSEVDGEPAVRAIRLGMQPVDVTVAADIVVRALNEERFLILTHPGETIGPATLRATDPEVYIAAMRELWQVANNG